MQKFEVEYRDDGTVVMLNKLVVTESHECFKNLKLHFDQNPLKVIKRFVLVNLKVSAKFCEDFYNFLRNIKSGGLVILETYGVFGNDCHMLFNIPYLLLREAGSHATREIVVSDSGNTKYLESIVNYMNFQGNSLDSLRFLNVTMKDLDLNKLIKSLHHKNNNLSELDFDKVSFETFEGLDKFDGVGVKLKSIKFCFSTKLDNESFLKLSSLLSKFKFLEKISVSHESKTISINGKGAKSIFNICGIEGNLLKEIDLSKNKNVGVQSIRSLSRKLDTSVLTELSLSECNLCEPEINVLIEYIKDPRNNLYYLDVSGNTRYDNSGTIVKKECPVIGLLDSLKHPNNKIGYLSISENFRHCVEDVYKFIGENVLTDKNNKLKFLECANQISGPVEVEESNKFNEALGYIYKSFRSVYNNLKQIDIRSSTFGDRHDPTLVMNIRFSKGIRFIHAFNLNKDLMAKELRNKRYIEALIMFLYPKRLKVNSSFVMFPTDLVRKLKDFLLV